jgi:transcriptional regulator with XRE-family HTH domain
LELHLSTWGLAELVGMHRSHIVRIEHGDIRQPGPEKLARLAAVLDLPLARLYRLAGYPTGGQLPSFHSYLLHRYRQLPPEAIDKLDRYFDEIRREYQPDEAKPDGPQQEAG